MSRELVEEYAAGGEKLSLAIRGLTREDLRCRPAEDAGVGKWSIQEVVVHLCDCDQVYADRIKRVIAEENPTLLAFDENLWAGRLAYDAQSAEDAVTLIQLVRKQVGTILRAQDVKTWERAGTHSQAGKKTVRELVRGSVQHLEHHLKFIHAKRAKMGKEMW